MGVYKEIPRADGSGLTEFFRLDDQRDTVEIDIDEITKNMHDYNLALNKPSINNVPLVGNKTLTELGIQPKGNYLTSIPGEYITESELSAKQYATQAWVRDRINEVEHFHREIVDALPLVGKDNVLYLVKKKGTVNDIYNEYIWTGVDYELIGTTAADFSDYYNKKAVDNLLLNKVDKVNGKQLSTNDYTTAEKNKLASLSNYDDAPLQDKVNALHNYDDTEVKNDISSLQSQVDGLVSSVDGIDTTLEDAVMCIRLIKAGDAWNWQNIKGDILTFTQAQEALGHEDTCLFLERLEMDGKIVPAFYVSENTQIRILFTDIDKTIHLLIIKSNLVNDTVLGTEMQYGNSVANASNLPSTGNKGEIREVTNTKEFYIYNGTEWLSLGHNNGSDIDLSNYLAKNNITPYTPTGNYNPATKKYVDDSILGLTPGGDDDNNIFYWDGSKSNTAIFDTIIDYLNSNNVAILLANVDGDIFQYNLTSVDFNTDYGNMIRLISIPKNINSGDYFESYTIMHVKQCVIILDMAGTRVSNITEVSASDLNYNIIEPNNPMYGTPFTPTLPQDPATKQYVDSRIAKASSQSQAVTNSAANQGVIYWWEE